MPKLLKRLRGYQPVSAQPKGWHEADVGEATNPVPKLLKRLRGHQRVPHNQAGLHEAGVGEATNSVPKLLKWLRGYQRVPHKQTGLREAGGGEATSPVPRLLKRLRGYQPVTRNQAALPKLLARLRGTRGCTTKLGCAKREVAKPREASNPVAKLLKRVQVCQPVPHNLGVARTSRAVRFSSNKGLREAGGGEATNPVQMLVKQLRGLPTIKDLLFLLFHRLTRKWRS